MPPEIKDFDWDTIKPSGMTAMTLSYSYNQVWTAIKTGLTPGQFRMLPYHEQAELSAYWYVSNRINEYQADENRQEGVRKQNEMNKKANQPGNRR